MPPGLLCWPASADRQVGLAVDQRLPGAGQHLAAQAQPRRRRLVAVRRADLGEGLAPARTSSASRSRRRQRSSAASPSRWRRGARGWPTASHLLQQPAAFVQQLAAGGGRAGPGASCGRTAARRARPRAGARCRSAPTAPCRVRARPRQSCRCGRWCPSSPALRGSARCGCRCGGRPCLHVI